MMTKYAGSPSWSRCMEALPYAALGAIMALLPVSSVATDVRHLDLDQIAGVYKHRFPNADITGRSFQSEDVLEIVKLSRDRAYIRTDLEFFNGHTCFLLG